MSSVLRGFMVLLIGLTLIFFQGTIMHALLPAAVTPNLLIVLVVFLAFYEATVFGTVLVFVLGVILDMYSSSLLVGPWAAAFVTVFGVLALLSQRIFVESFWAAVLSGLLASLLSDLVYLLVVFEFHPTGTQFVSIAFLSAVATAIVAPPLFFMLRWILSHRWCAVSGAMKAME